MKLILSSLWLILWGLVLAAVLSAAASLPFFIVSSAFGISDSLILMVVYGLTGLSCFTLYAVSVYGFFTRWYLSWLVMSLSFHLATFICGLVFLLLIVLLEPNIVNFLTVFFTSVLLWISHFMLRLVKSEGCREAFLVDKYV